MPVPTFTLACTRHERIANGVFTFAFAKPEGFTFTPGQFVLFDVPAMGNPADIQPRALSIASTPGEKDLLFVAKMKEGGRASMWIERVMRPGTAAVIKGPFGRFVVDQTTDKDYLFIATGAGVAPFRSQIEDALARGDARRMDLIFGNRSEQDVFWAEEFTQLSQSYGNFFLHLALSAPSDSWAGHRGRVQTLVPLIAKDIAQKSIYICGNPDMTTEVKKLCLEEWRVPKDNVHAEAYI